jgi:hypothetical protein
MRKNMFSILRRAKRLFCTVSFALTALVAVEVHAQTYCDAKNPQVHVSGKLVWCADPTFWAAHAADVTPFFAYADKLLPQLASAFGTDAAGPFYIVVNQPNGGASTPTPYGPGINITGDAFYTTAYGIKGFYGYLLVTHEFVNQWTGLMGGSGWPTDWWANHRSPFPNAMDSFIMAKLGQTQAAAAQTARFVAGGDSADAEVVMFTNLLNKYGGFAFVQRITAMLRADAMQWGGLMDPPGYTKSTMFVSGNPSALRSSYVAAYLALSAGVDITPALTQSGVGTAPPNWPTGQSFQQYTLNSNTVAAIAKAHCALRSAEGNGLDISTPLSAFQKGQYASVSYSASQAPCLSGCPAECGCSSQGACVPKWLSTGTSVAAASMTSGAANNAFVLTQNLGFSLDIPGGNTAAGTPVQIWQANNTSSQKWQITANRITGLGQCLQASSSAPGASVTLQPCSSSALQQWQVINHAVKLAGTSVCLALPSNVMNAGAKLQVNTCNAASSQMFNPPVQATNTTVSPQGSKNLCMNLSGARTSDATPISITTCNATAAQKWTLQSGQLSVLGTCLVANSVAQGSPVQSLACSKATRQYWTQQGNAWQLSGTSLCLDIPNNNLVSGQQLRLWTCNNSVAQSFTMQ